MSVSGAIPADAPATAPLTVTRAHGDAATQQVVAAVDIGKENPALWMGALSHATGRFVFYAWERRPLTVTPVTTATAQQVELARRITNHRVAHAVTDWCIEQQLPHNSVTGRSENVAAYGLQSAIVGALTARPLGATKRVYVRSPRHKFTVLGVDKHLISKKPLRKRLTTQIVEHYIRRYEHHNSPARKAWDAAAPKQDDMADAFLMGATDLLELDARAHDPRGATLLDDLRTVAQHCARHLEQSASTTRRTLPSKSATPTARRKKK